MSPRSAIDIDALRSDLVRHAQTVIAQEGVQGLTMRALASKSGTAVGLSYKAFASRDDLLWTLTWNALVELADRLDEWSATPGGSLADRLMEFHDIHQGSLAPTLVAHLSRGPRREELFRRSADAGIIRSWHGIVTEFLRVRQVNGEIRRDVNVEAFAFIITAALHHVLASKKQLPVPDRPTLARYIAELAACIST